MAGREGRGVLGLRSLDVVEDVVWRERDAQLQHFDSLDAKAGVILGFAAALAALAPPGVNLVVELGRALAVIGALVALAAFWPRGYGAIDLRAFRDRYLAAEKELTPSPRGHADRDGCRARHRPRWEGQVAAPRDDLPRARSALRGHGRRHRLMGGSMETEPRMPRETPPPAGETEETPRPAEETPPPFQPDPEIVTVLERGVRDEARLGAAVRRRAGS